MQYHSQVIQSIQLFYKQTVKVFLVYWQQPLWIWKKGYICIFHFLNGFCQWIKSHWQLFILVLLKVWLDTIVYAEKKINCLLFHLWCTKNVKNYNCKLYTENTLICVIKKYIIQQHYTQFIKYWQFHWMKTLGNISCSSTKNNLHMYAPMCTLTWLWLVRCYNLIHSPCRAVRQTKKGMEI